MATLCATLVTSHSPYLYATPEEWESSRARRAERGGFAADVPVDTSQENQAKFHRCMRAMGRLRTVLADARPDVLLIFGDDQGEQFGFGNFPALSIFLGKEFDGYKVAPEFGLPAPGTSRSPRPKSPDEWVTVKGHPGLAKYLMEGLVERGFDMSFSMELPDKDEGIGHAFMRPSYYLRPDYDLPTVPIFVNCFFAPQPTGVRCYELGRAVGALIDQCPDDLRVAVLGSGGLWHTPGAPGSIVNGPFDNAVLDAVRAGDAARMAEFFDSQRPDEPMADTPMSPGTGMRGGLSAGTGEIRNWIAAAAVVDGQAGVVVDYVPVHASPVGMAFAYWPSSDGVA